MSYVIQADLYFLIQQDNLNQVVGLSVAKIIKAIRIAESEAKSYLVQKYDLDYEMTDTSPYVPTQVYKARNRVYLDGPTYSPTAAYALGALSSFTNTGKNNSQVYICTSAIASPGEAFNPAHWGLLGWSGQLFYGAYPHDPFDPKDIYAVGDVIWYNDNIYTCVIETSSLSWDARIQANQAALPEYFNIYPDDPIQGVKYWGMPTLYTIPAGSILNADLFVDGDNRNQQFLNYVVDIALYHVHTRIAPENIPMLRIRRYCGDEHDIKLANSGAIYPSYSALGWLQSCAAEGGTTADLPLLPKKYLQQGQRIRWGSDQKQQNNY